jgi:Uncharacterized protein conserved in bacteria (DUF2330)
MLSRRSLVTLFGMTAAMSAAMTFERDAAACGGCFTPPTETESVITDERMIFSISKDQTTLYDQIQYSGSPSSFAWVLPIKGSVTVGLSADIMFNTIDQLTATQVVEPPTNCPPPPTCNFNGPQASLAAGAAADAGSADGGVVVTSQAQVGPYETVQLHSTDGSALTNWLTSHGYNIAKEVVPVIQGYVTDQFDFLALKLVPGVGVQSMQPVRVTSKGASVSLPLRMVAIGTGATTGISIWVIADGRWEPQNFPTFTINDSEIAWDWATSSSNYESLRLSKEAALNGRGWQFESSLELSQYTIQQTLDQSLQYGYSGVGGYLSAESSTSDAGAGDAGGDAGASDAASDSSEGFDSAAANAQVSAANADLQILFTGIAGANVRISRMRSDVAHSALTADMYLQASSDQAELTNLHYPQKQVGQPLCPVYDSNCVQTGELPRDQAIAAANGGCNATRAPGRSGVSLAIILGLAGFGAARIRRRRSRR